MAFLINVHLLPEILICCKGIDGGGMNSEQRLFQGCIERH